jgi:SAM-dependent methyltransferase
MSNFRQTYEDLEPIIKDIVAKVRTVPPDQRPGTAHIDHIACIMQYVFYTSLVREWLPNSDASVLDWGGQHGQLSLLLSRYYQNTTCYVLEGDQYDRNYGLSDWHRLLGVKGVVRASDPKRIILSQQFDAVISSGVFEHVTECGGDERASMEELHRVVKPGGLLFLWNLPRYFGREFFYPLAGRSGHIRRFRKKEIVDLLQTSNFKILYLSTHEILPLKVLKVLNHIVAADRLVYFDYRISERLSFLPQNFTIVARPK